MRKMIVIMITALFFLMAGSMVIVNFDMENDNEAAPRICGSRGTVTVGADQTYTTIQDGINNANPGDLIRIYNGVYPENVDLNKPVTLEGNGTGTVIDAGQNGPGIIFNADFANVTLIYVTNSEPVGPAIRVNSDANRIENCNISNSNFGVALEASSNNTKVANNTFETIAGTGVIISSSQNHTVRNNTFLSPVIGGIRLSSSDLNTIQRNILSDSTGSGIELDDSDKNKIEENELLNTQIGIIFTGSSNNTVFRNNVRGCLDIAIALDDSNDNQLEENNATDGKSGFVISGGSRKNTLLNNIAGNNTETGILLSESDNNTIDWNYCYGNDLGIELDSSSGSIIKTNTVEDGVLIRNGSYENKFWGNELLDSSIWLSELDMDIEQMLSNDIPVNNTVNTKPIYLYRSQDMDNAPVPADAGGIIAVDTQNLLITDLNISNVDVGLQLYGCSYVTVENCTFSDSKFGILGVEVDNSSILYSFMERNENNGTLIVNSNNNFFSDNTWFQNGDWGVMLSGSLGNTLTNNYILENDKQAYDDQINLWDDNGKGNYWSDILIPDENNDGFVDVPVDIGGSGGAKDNHPICPVLITAKNQTPVEDVPYFDYCVFGHSYQPKEWGIRSNAPWLNINLDNGSIYGTPTNDDVGIWWVNASIADDYMFKQMNFTLEVLNTNDAPYINVSDSEDAVEDALYIWQYTAVDVDAGAVLSWALDTNAGFLEIGSANGTVQGIPENADVGEFWVNVSVSDTYALDFTNFTLTVQNTNDAPIGDVISPLDGQEFTLMEAINFTASALDDDLIHGDVLTITWDFGNGDTKTGLSVEYSYLLPGEYTVTLNVSDEAGAFSVTTLMISISPEVPGTDNITKLIEDVVDIAGSLVTLRAGVKGEGSFVITEVGTEKFNEILSALGLNTSDEIPGSIGLFVDVNFEGLGEYEWINISLEYGSLPAAINESNLKLYYWDGADWVMAETTGVIPSENIVWANVTHLTIFAALDKSTSDMMDDDTDDDIIIEDPDDDDDDDDPDEIGWVVWVAVGIILVFLVVAVAFFIIRSKKGIEEEEEEEVEVAEIEDEDEEEGDEFDSMSRQGLKMYIMENELEVTVTKKMSDEEIRSQIRLAKEPEEVTKSFDEVFASEYGDDALEELHEALAPDDDDVVEELEEEEEDELDDEELEDEEEDEDEFEVEEEEEGEE